MSDKVNNSARLPTVVIVGRPNVGKSSLFNAIIGRRLSIVHEMSGVTRDRLAAPAQRDGRRFMLVDTGGLSMLEGESRQVDFWDTGIARQVECAIADADVLIMVGDAQAGVTPLDRDIANFTEEGIREEMAKNGYFFQYLLYAAVLIFISISAVLIAYFRA